MNMFPCNKKYEAAVFNMCMEMQNLEIFRTA